MLLKNATAVPLRPASADRIGAQVRPAGVVSVVIRVRNAASDLRRCLAAVRRQVLPTAAQLQIIVVDNESSDNSAAVARRFGAEVVTISAQQFSWGRALNLGIAASRGEVVLLLSADACPTDEIWLIEMLRPLSDRSVCASFGRQMPRPDAPLDEIARLERMFPATAADGQPLIAPSNACAAIRRSAWEQARFDETIAAAEERPWMQAMSRLGYRCVYVPSARVLHSHRDPLFRFALRLIELEARTRGRQNAWLRIHELVHCAAALVKRRVVNLASTQAQWRVRIEALMRLPCEIGVIFFLGILGRNSRLWHLLRGPAWG